MKINWKRFAPFAALLILAAITTACSALAELGPMTDAGENFLKAMKASDHHGSYAMLSSSLQKEIGGEEGWDKFCEPRVPTEWSISNKSIENGRGKLTGTVNFANGQKLQLGLVLEKEGDAWKLIGINFDK